jgi:hypothetical protein
MTRTGRLSFFISMINPLAHFRIKGAIWYRGEANAERPVEYRKLFPALIEDWRRHWGYELPFLFVQLAGFGPNKPAPAEYPWAELREAQWMTLALRNTGMATAIDIGDENDIHPKDKQDVAHRLALAAENVVYGENILDSGPPYESMWREGDRLRIRFSNLGTGLLVKDKYGYARGFKIAGVDGKFSWGGRGRMDTPFSCTAMQSSSPSLCVTTGVTHRMATFTTKKVSQRFHSGQTRQRCQRERAERCRLGGRSVVRWCSSGRNLGSGASAINFGM